jgi:cephalosporin hydroxylase
VVSIESLYSEYDRITNSIGMAQDRAEIVSALYEIYQKIGMVDTILEVGSYYGGSACLLSNLLTDTGKIILIEPEYQVKVDRGFLEEYIGKDRWYLINRCVEDPATVPEVEHILGSSNVGVLMIDDGHLISDVERDYSTFGKYVTRGAILIHDICDSYEDGPQVMFNRLAGTHKHSKFNTNYRKLGIGIIYVGEGV